MNKPKTFEELLTKKKPIEKRQNSKAKKTDNQKASKKIESEKNEKKSDSYYIDVLDLRFLGSFARALKIPKYQHIHIDQLKLQIGKRLIELSGLVDIEKIMKEMREEE